MPRAVTSLYFLVGPFHSVASVKNALREVTPQTALFRKRNCFFAVAIFSRDIILPRAHFDVKQIRARQGTKFPYIGHLFPPLGGKVKEKRRKMENSLFWESHFRLNLPATGKRVHSRGQRLLLLSRKKIPNRQWNPFVRFPRVI